MTYTAPVDWSTASFVGTIDPAGVPLPSNGDPAGTGDAIAGDASNSPVQITLSAIRALRRGPVRARDTPRDEVANLRFILSPLLPSFGATPNDLEQRSGQATALTLT
jgi:hypothetical protein